MAWLNFFLNSSFELCTDPTLADLESYSLLRMLRWFSTLKNYKNMYMHFFSLERKEYS
jgi:hypothetical protein